MHKAWRGVPLLILAVGVGYTIYLQTLVTDEVFYSCDGGVKFLLTKQFAERGLSGARLDLDLRPPHWVRALWLGGFHPLVEPFAYRRGDRWYMQYPVFFAVASAPLYRWFGYHGLYIIPLLSIWLLWMAFHAACRRLGIRPGLESIGLALLVFGSPVTVYAAMFWEHAPALLLSFVGAAWLMCGPGNSRAGAVFAGLAVGAAGWLRPEMMFVAAGMAMLAVVRRRSLGPAPNVVAFAASVVLTTCAFLTWNLWLSGSMLGFHGIQAVDDPAGHVRSAPEFVWFYVRSLAWYFPPAMAMLCAAGLRPVRVRLGAGVSVVLVMCAGLLAVLPFIFPNDGGKQWGPRYFFFLIPVTTLAAVKFVGDLRQAGYRRAGTIGVVVLLGMTCWGMDVNTRGGTEDLKLDYRLRILPDLNTLRSLPEEVVVTNSVFFSSELTTTFESRLWFCLPKSAGSAAGFATAMNTLATQMNRHGHRRVVFLLDSIPNFPTEIPVATPEGPMVFRVVMRNAPGTFYRATLDDQ